MSSPETAAGEPKRLPLNRNERFWTATVLPAVVCADNFKFLSNFLGLCGLPVAELPVSPETDPQLQVFTEYSFSSAVVTPSEVAAFPGLPLSARTPDVVLRGSGWLVAVEGKMWSTPSAASLKTQIAEQAPFVQYWAQHFGLPPTRVRHLLLLPPTVKSELKANLTPIPVIDWDQVRIAYDGIAAPYWTGLLTAAVHTWGVRNPSSPHFGTNLDAKRTGAQIVADWQTGKPEYPFMGRKLGLHGSELAKDIDGGKWFSHVYEIRKDPLPGNSNWFSVEAFVALITHNAAGS